MIEQENFSGGWSLDNEEARLNPSNPFMAGWSGDLHELTWWFYKTPDWRWYFGRLKRDPSCRVFQVGRWGVHVRFKNE